MITSYVLATTSVAAVVIVWTWWSKNHNASQSKDERDCPKQGQSPVEMFCGQPVYVHEEHGCLTIGWGRQPSEALEASDIRPFTPPPITPKKTREAIARDWLVVAMVRVCLHSLTIDIIGNIRILAPLDIDLLQLCLQAFWEIRGRASLGRVVVQSSAKSAITAINCLHKKGLLGFRVDACGTLTLAWARTGEETQALDPDKLVSGGVGQEWDTVVSSVIFADGFTLDVSGRKQVFLPHDVALLELCIQAFKEISSKKAGK